MLRMKISHRQFNQADGESWSPEIITIQPKYGTRSGYFTTVCFIVKGAGPSFSGKAISSDGHNSPKKQRMKNSDDNVFHYVLTWVEGGRDKGWVIHYRPQHPPLSADLEAA